MRLNHEISAAAQFFSLLVFANVMGKKGGVINVTSMNISPEICQRCNEILFCDPEPEISVLGIQ